TAAGGWREERSYASRACTVVVRQIATMIQRYCYQAAFVFIRYHLKRDGQLQRGSQVPDLGVVAISLSQRNRDRLNPKEIPMKKIVISMLALGGALALQPALAQDGESLFKSKACAACHSIDAKLVGPSYKEV